MRKSRFLVGIGLLLAACGSAPSASAPSPTGSSAPATAVATVEPTPAFVPSPAVRSSAWPAGGQVPAALAGGWQEKVETFPMYIGGYTMQFGPIAANAVVSGSTIYFISDVCTNAGTYGYDTYHYTLTGDTLVLTRVGAWNCGWRLQSTYTRVP